MKIHVWIPIEDAVINKLNPDNWSTVDPDNSKWVQVSITPDQLQRLIDEVKETILAMVDSTRSEEGNEVYNFYEEKNNEGKIISFHLFEVYKSSAALDFHRNTSHYKNYRSKIVDLLDRPIEVKVLNSIDAI